MANPLQFRCFYSQAHSLDDCVDEWLTKKGDIDIVSVHQSCVAAGRDHEDCEVLLSIFYRRKD